MTDNPSAFPTHPDGQGHPLFTGMTLRDYFAGQALAGVLANQESTSLDGTPEEFAADAYSFADAMLAERARTEPPR